MILRRRFSLGGAAAFTLLSLAGLSPARSDAPPPPARTLEGIAATASGKPLAHATLYLFALPPGQTDMITLGDQSTVVTDDRGRWTWAVPDSLPPLSDYVGVRPIDCYALAADQKATQFRLALRSNLRGTDAEQGDRSVLESETRRCETRWQLGGPHPVLSVVVPDTSDVTLTVRGPDGLPLAGREVQIARAEGPSVYGGAVLYTGRTDAGGRLRLRFFPGSLRLQVFVPGIGFGSTGTFDLGPGESIAPAVPPLAPFAHLSGTASAALIGPKTSVHEDYHSENDWYDPRGGVDAGGKWTLDGVLPGPHRLVLADGRGESASVSVSVTPGERLGGLTFIPIEAPVVAVPPPPSVSPLEGILLPAVSLPDAGPVIRGRVTDAGGKPVVGADVYAACSFPMGMRFKQSVLAATSDFNGNYQIPLPAIVGSSELSAYVVARVAGFGLAVGDGRSKRGRDSDPWMDMHVDLVLSDAHSGLTVRVLKDGKPLPSARVELTRQGENNLSFRLYGGGNQVDASQALQALLTPSAQTGPDGAAHFADLTPGLWDVSANRPTAPWPGDPMPMTPFNLSTGVSVKAGQEHSYTVSVRPPPASVAFRILAPNGLPSGPAPVLAILTTAKTWEHYGSLTLTPDGAGNTRGDFFAPGLFRVTARFRDAPDAAPLDDNALSGSFNEGATLVVASSVTAAHPPFVIPTRRMGPSSLRVRLEDEQGRPQRGTVSATVQYRDDQYAASADALGRVVFPNMPSGLYTLTARLAGRPARTALNQAGSPVLSDAALLTGGEQPLPQTVTVRAGSDTDVAFRPQGLGYLRLHFVGVIGASQDYFFDGRLPSDRDFVQSRLDPKTGEFLVGPLPAGPRTFYLFRQTRQPAPGIQPLGTAAVTVEAGRVVRAALAVQEPAGPPLLLDSLTLNGTVLMPDGKTPAWGARVGLFTADRPMPMPMARADAAGRLALKDYWREPWRPEQSDVGNPTGPVLAAWLPGANGATVVPYVPGQDVRLVLPPAVALHGRVTVGGQPVLGLPPSLYRVRAQCQGRGTLNDALSVETTAQADGTFDLAGLTPGTYRVQTARDDVWLSEAQTLTVGPGPPADLTLDVGPPGLPLILHLEDGKGRARPGQTVSIARPDGPLTAQIWPKGLTSDGAGDLRVDGLEVGPHRLTAAGETVSFDVPAWTADTAPGTRRVVLRQLP